MEFKNIGVFQGRIKLILGTFSRVHCQSFKNSSSAEDSPSSDRPGFNSALRVRTQLREPGAGGGCYVLLCAQRSVSAEPPPHKGFLNGVGVGVGKELSCFRAAVPGGDLARVQLQ